ncbi:MAG TPA: hypothetical protein VI031_01885 [Pyrinomonadaceae bacterium]
MDEPHKIKSIVWIGSSLRDLRLFPDEVKEIIGYALYQAQLGATPKPDIDLIKKRLKVAEEDSKIRQARER